MKFKNLISILFKNRKAETNLPLNDISEDEIETDTDAKDLSLLIGDKIKEVKIFFEPQGENGWLDYNLAYIYLEQNGVINFPFCGSTTFGKVSRNKNAQPMKKEFQNLIYDHAIKDILYEMDENFVADGDSFAYLELSNGVVLHENRMAPHGTGHANLFIYMPHEFQKRKADFNIHSWTQLAKE